MMVTGAARGSRCAGAPTARMRSAQPGAIICATVLVAIISDTHLPRARRALSERCVAHLRGAEHIVHAGDFSHLSVLDDLQRLGPPVSAVHGNTDEPALRERLPTCLELELDGVRVGVVHDAGSARGRLPRLRERFPGVAAVVFGHSHIPLLENDGGLTIFNPGSPTDRRRQPQHTMGLAHVNDGRIEFQLVSLGT
jgi:uncharacterized protein